MRAYHDRWLRCASSTYSPGTPTWAHLASRPDASRRMTGPDKPRRTVPHGSTNARPDRAVRFVQVPPRRTTQDHMLTDTVRSGTTGSLRGRGTGMGAGGRTDGFAFSRNASYHARHTRTACTAPRPVSEGWRPVSWRRACTTSRRTSGSEWVSRPRSVGTASGPRRVAARTAAR